MGSISLEGLKKSEISTMTPLLVLAAWPPATPVA